MTVPGRGLGDEDDRAKSILYKRAKKKFGAEAGPLFKRWLNDLPIVGSICGE
jgi:hypothetical protein